MTIRRRFATGLAILAAALALAPAASIAQQVLSTPYVVAPLKSLGVPPVLSTCGTSPAIGQGANGIAGRLVTGSLATTCTITFGTAYAVAPACVVSAEVPTQPTYTVSATAITFSVSIASTPYHYVCMGVGS
jgi:hypothetical protein